MLIILSVQGFHDGFVYSSKVKIWR